jgi:hypothetical protein
MQMVFRKIDVDVWNDFRGIAVINRLRVNGSSLTVNGGGNLRLATKEYSTLLGVGCMIRADQIGRFALFTSCWAIAGNITRKLHINLSFIL